MLHAQLVFFFFRKWKHQTLHLNVFLSGVNKVLVLVHQDRDVSVTLTV